VNCGVSVSERNHSDVWVRANVRVCVCVCVCASLCACNDVRDIAVCM
jgi:hypothetical protein